MVNIQKVQLSCSTIPALSYTYITDLIPDKDISFFSDAVHLVDNMIELTPKQRHLIAILLISPTHGLDLFLAIDLDGPELVKFFLQVGFILSIGSKGKNL